MARQHAAADLVLQAVRKWQGQLTASAFSNWRDITAEAKSQDRSILQIAGRDRRFSTFPKHIDANQKTSIFILAWPDVDTPACCHLPRVRMRPAQRQSLTRWPITVACRRHILARWAAATRQQRRLGQCFSAVALCSSALLTRSVWTAWQWLCESQQQKAAKMRRAILLMRSHIIGWAFAGWRSR